MNLLLLICVSALCVTAGALLVQTPPFLSVPAGSKVNLQCDVTETGGRCSEVAWLHVGQVSNLRVSSVVSGADRGKVCRLEISKATLQDVGRHYCVYINGLLLQISSGTMLTVTESQLQSPAVELLVPSDVNSFLPIPLTCLVSGVKDPDQVTVDWEVVGADGIQQLSPTILPVSQAVVISQQVHVPAESWSAGVEVSCVLNDGELSIRKTVSSRLGKSSQCVLLASITGAVCVVLLTVAMALSVLLLCRQRRIRGKSEGPPNISEEASAELHYAALRFKPSDRRNVP
ncbi:uncharacterized protein LOC118471849 [Amphiprion ocellaris]|uniref:uncharacterized protein LOC118471849 n=1 Tax=Amphiprion ocellaris TaxID=80972 RepID=UPI0024116CDE|nr:uncharacterized protein LOC118471849 [Amphiprion ocellaris]